MTIAVGTRLGPYEVLSALGAGGMGEVYRAHDTKLGRDVALKVLPDSLAHDPERLARFEREAHLLAALNHPSIAHIHGFEDSTGTPALVMELVDGPTLADRIAQGPIPLDEALQIAKQIAEALEAAHEQGIIHRDLKPANIKVRSDGTVKVLDFGLAKAFDPSTSSGAGATMSPTLSIHATQAGIILGTAAYMAPEQARGKSVDKRADIWAFGCVLFEMLTGRRAFDGDDISTTLASVLKTDPDWQLLPPTTPTGLRRLLSRCLKKDPKDRLQAIGDARIEIGELLGGTLDGMAPAPAVSILGVPHRGVGAVVGATLVAGTLVGALATTAALRGRSVIKAEPMRFAMPLPARQTLTPIAGVQLALSPDGRRLVYSAVSTGSRDPVLMMRAIDRIDAEAIKGLSSPVQPFFSPDGRWVGYVEGASSVGSIIKKVSVTGGPPITVCRTNGIPAGATWGLDDTIIFATSSPGAGLSAVPAGGGDTRVLTRPDMARGELMHVHPSELPNGRGVLFTIVPTAANADNVLVAILDLRTGKYKTVIRGGAHGVYVDGGYLVYSAAGALRAVRFDPDTLEVSGDPVPVVEQVMTTTVAGQYAVSRTGSLVYVPGTEGGTNNLARRTLAWIDRRGREQAIAVPPRAYVWARISPDGARVALDVRDQDQDIWMLDLARQTLTRVTFEPGIDGFPIWTPDSRQILFESNRGGGVFNVFRQSADNTGDAEQLTRSATPLWPFSISPDGTRAILQETTPKTGRDLDLLTLDGKAKPEPLLHTTFAETNGEISPDGHWLAYQSDESGTDQIYVRPFPNVNAGHWQVSSGGGSLPAWSPNGRELFYLAANALMAVPVHGTTTFRADNPTKLFQAPPPPPIPVRYYDVSRDGQRFLMIKSAPASEQATTSTSIVMVLNWVEELKRLVPTK